MTLEEFEAGLERRRKTLRGRLRHIYWMFYHYLDFKDYCRRLKWFYQRGKRGWADCDWWGMDNYLISIILPMLRELRAHKHGYPGDSNCNTPAKWTEKLSKMIEGFEAAERVANDNYDPDEKDWLKKLHQDMALFRKRSKIFINYFFHLWD